MPQTWLVIDDQWREPNLSHLSDKPSYTLVRTSAEAIAALRTTNFDVISLDYSLSVVNSEITTWPVVGYLCSPAGYFAGRINVHSIHIGAEDIAHELHEAGYIPTRCHLPWF